MKATPVYHSSIFWHFCGRNKSEKEAYETLYKILTDKVLNRPNVKCTRTANKFDANTETDEFQYACFADIPFPFLKHHIGNYGNIGIGFKPEYLIKRGAQPVIYVAQLSNRKKKRPQDWTVSLIIEELRKEFFHLQDVAKDKLQESDTKQIKKTMHQFDVLRNLIKQFSVKDAKSAYYEREWRVINVLSFELSDIEIVIIPRRFVSSFVKNFPEIPYSISELIIS